MYDSYKRFNEIPAVDKQRSQFDMPYDVKTSFNQGELVPLAVYPILPGDTIKLDFAHVTRMTTPIVPVMDNAMLDVFAFFVPWRLIWDHSREFFGENTQTHWEPQVEYELPQIEPPSGGWSEGSLADQLGYPTGISGKTYNHLRMRAYCKIWNDWFRSEALKDPCMITMDETTLTGVNKGANYDYVTDTELGASCARVARLHDMFSSCLPEPQYGPDVNVPLGSSAPVIWSDLERSALSDSDLVGKPAAFVKGSSSPYVVDAQSNEDPQTSMAAGKGNGLMADLSNAIGASVNQLRTAFAIQRYYEQLARGGSRYVEYLRNIFGVISPDARQQRSEFLGSRRFPINIDQVLQTSSTDAVSPQGNTAAYSCTVNSSDLCTYSSTEHGYLLVLGCVRVNHSYQYGVDYDLLCKKTVDIYVPQFAHLGEMGVKNAEIYAQGTDKDDEIFGYQEAWVSYRFKKSEIHGKLKSQATGSLDIWTYADKYNSLPMLSGEWIDEPEENIQRSLAVQNEPQFIMDAYFPCRITRVMPMYSVPGLLDHF